MYDVTTYLWMNGDSAFRVMYGCNEFNEDDPTVNGWLHHKARVSKYKIDEMYLEALRPGAKSLPSKRGIL